MENIEDLKIGNRAWWWNSLSCKNRACLVTKVLKYQYIIEADDGYIYKIPKSMVSKTPVEI